MAIVPAAKTMTADEYLAYPPKTFGFASNLVEGEVVMGQPAPLHQRVTANLLVALRSWTDSGPGRGYAYMPLDVDIDERNLYAPDLGWWPDGRDPADEGERPFSLPAIAAEVRSPSTWRYDVGAKKSGYEREGLQELWLVDTAANEVIVFKRSAPSSPAFDVSAQLAAGDVLESPLLAGFALPLEQLFR